MAYVLNLTNVIPPVRYDGTPWTTIIVQEADSATGDYSTIGSVDLSTLSGGLDSDPSNPQERNVTVTNATIPQGWYQLVFQDANGATSQPSEPIHNAPSVNDDIRPSLEDLAAILHVRTVAPGSGGKELGVFTDQTRPTAAEMDRLIDQAVAQVMLKTGPGVADQWRDEARTVVMYLAAMLEEISFYKDEIAKDISAFPMFQQMYRDALEGLIDSMESDTPGTPTLGVFTIPIRTQSQANFRNLMHAVDPATGMIDPNRLPPDMDYPNGIGGLPPEYYTAVNGWPLFDLGGASFLDEW